MYLLAVAVIPRLTLGASYTQSLPMTLDDRWPWKVLDFCLENSRTWKVLEIIAPVLESPGKI